MQWPAAGTRSAASPDQVSRTMRQLELEQEELKRTVGRLREKLDARQQNAPASSEMLEDLRVELTEQKMRAGLIDVRGPGVRIVLDDSRLNPGGSADDLLIHDYDLRDVVTVLWLAGAEAIGINGERIVSGTSIYCVGSTVMVNDTRLSPPYQISAIGDAVQMQDHLRNPAYLSDLKARSSRHGLRIESVRVDAVTIPAYRGSLPLRYAQLGD
jgi:uncharacterized protein YlxW (UPF0749 family)